MYAVIEAVLGLQMFASLETEHEIARDAQLLRLASFFGFRLDHGRKQRCRSRYCRIRC